MAKRKSGNHIVSRRKFLQGMRWAPVLFLPAPIHTSNLRPLVSLFSFDGRKSSFSFADSRLIPQYPSKSPLDDVLRLVAPGSDEFVTEKYASEIGRLLDEWGRALRASAPALEVVRKFLDPSIESGLLSSTQEKTVRSENGLGISRRQFGGKITLGREHFLGEVKTYFDKWPRLETAEFEIIHLEEIAGKPPRLRADIRYDFVATPAAGAAREERIGLWRTEWSRDESNAWRVVKWQAAEETVSRARDPVFVDVTSRVVGQIESYKNQLAHGADHWRTVLDGACGIDVYGNNGLAVGDFDNDGLDDLYI